MSNTLQIPTQPRILVFESEPPLSDEEFEKLCLANDLFRLERTKDGKIEVNPPAAGFTSDGNAEIIYQLREWWNFHERGRVFDSSAGFFLPDGSMLKPGYCLHHERKIAEHYRSARTAFPSHGARFRSGTAF